MKFGKINWKGLFPVFKIGGTIADADGNVAVKTVNGESIIGAGNIEIAGASTGREYIITDEILVNGVVSLYHGLNAKVLAQVYENGNLMLADLTTRVDDNTVKVDMSSYLPLDGTTYTLSLYPTVPIPTEAVPVDKTALNASIAEVGTLSDMAYTDETFNVVLAIIVPANAVAADVDATQAEVDTVNASLRAALNGLVLKEIP